MIALVMGAAGCHDARPPGEGLGSGSESTSDRADTGTDTAETDAGSTGEPPPPDACADACLDLASQAGIATCHSCRCKAAFDDWLPSVDELQCKHAEPIVTYHAELSDTDYVLEPTGLGVFEYNDGTGCVTCHDHDPFIYTPHLQSTRWKSVAANKGLYHLVDLRGVPRSTGVMHLVSPQADACTSCHRLGSANTCSYFAPDSLATHKIDAYEAEVHAAAEPGSPYWTLAYWMPSAEAGVADFGGWEAAFAEAREHVLQCCDAPGIDGGGCQWAVVPAE